MLFVVKIKNTCGPNWCGSVGWASSCKPKGCHSDSHSGHMLALQARSGPQLGALERQPVSVSLPLSLSPPSPLSKKINK